MARNAMAQEMLYALRREIARIESVLPERLAAPGEDGVVLRHGTAVTREATFSALLETGAAGLDSALDGGVPLAALTEIHGAETRDAGAAAGFTLALASLANKKQRQEGRGTVCWIGTADFAREAGLPYAPGLKKVFGLSAGGLLFSATEKLADALWIAEEAARLDDLSAVILEIRGNPARLDLTATRRLHRRAQETGRPVFLIRTASLAEPTAAPLRLHVAPAPALPRRTLAGALEGSIGHPAFTVCIGKSRTSLPGKFVLEWNPDELSFHEIQPAHSGALVSLPAHRPHLPAAGGAVVALHAEGKSVPRHQPSREERPAHLRPRRTG